MTSTFDKIIESSEQIETLYELLYSIELAEGKESANYQKLLTQLKGLIEEETALYDSLDLTQISFYYARICSMLQDEATDIEAVVTNNIEGVMAVRIKNNLYRRIVNNNINSFLLLNRLGGVSEILKEAIFEGSEHNEVSSYIYNDFFNALVVIVNEHINSETDSNKRMQILKQKYRLSFIDNKLEEHLLNDDKTIYLVAKCLSDKYGVSKEKYEKIKISVLASICSTMIKQIMESKEDTTFKEMVIETCLLLLDNNTITDLNMDFHILADDQEGYEASEEKVVSCFKKVKQSKKTHQIMAFSLNA